MINDKHFFIYSDLGTNRVCIDQWILFFESYDCGYYLLMADDVKSGALNNGDVFIIPGGADLPYCELLNGKGNREIKQFVENGGIYIGVCAGAYYAHKGIDWQNTTETITGGRELSFFDGIATGPLVKPYNPDTTDGLTYIPVFFNDKKGMCYYKGGPIMVADNDTDVISNFLYNGKKYPAVMQKDIGLGKAVAICPHMEFSDKYMTEINAPDCENRVDIFHEIINIILL
ncbi:MAG: BPL-N domain-containing protein, partial [Alphaproteobacteria bacterium]